MVERGVGVRAIWTFLRPKDQLKNHDICAKPVTVRSRIAVLLAFTAYHVAPDPYICLSDSDPVVALRATSCLSACI
ncbi:hypothetical protein BDV33DRAFT_185264 [Aspergillus novoparasiticus]|uniref:Uncharacterized protein n=1 Tax=Aspergillus novoparasiticus TaxID=986946 RepID=A0A5N6E799_9EURO|nr:hypothetical protein BDV33DRAFT_185264 [Aspergillus novoparasiticus]